MDVHNSLHQVNAFGSFMTHFISPNFFDATRISPYVIVANFSPIGAESENLAIRHECVAWAVALFVSRRLTKCQLIFSPFSLK